MTARVRVLTIAIISAMLATTSAEAADKVRLVTSWFAEPEQGGFYEAQAEGLYAKAGLDVSIEMGGPQVNNLQILLAGGSDFTIGYDFQILNARARHLPLVTVATTFQSDIAGIMTHDDIPNLAALKGKPILIGSASRLTFWPWLMQKFGYADSQAQPYTFNLQPFFVDESLSTQGYITDEPFIARQHGEKVNFFLLADQGYPPYSTTIVTTDAYVAAHGDVVARFVKATLEGLRDYMKDPAPANKLIQAANPKMSTAELAYADKVLADTHVIDGGDAKTMSIGIMTEARWKATYDFMVGAKLLDPATDWKSAFTDRFVKGLDIH